MTAAAGSLAGYDDTTFPDNWDDLFRLGKPSLEWWKAFLNSDLLERTRYEVGAYSITLRASASLSTTASVLLIAHVLRSHQGLSSTYHRLVFGLSISDILFSSGFILSNLALPEELDYVIPGAQGNAATCTFEAFVLFVGGMMSQCYICSICFNYLAIIKYNKSDAYIEKELERWFHAISIVIPLVYGFITLAAKGLNVWGNVCFPRSHISPHCIGIEDGHTVEGFNIPCGRGNTFYKSIFYKIMVFTSISPPPIIIITTMIMMYHTVHRIERKAQQYGVSNLRLRVESRRPRVAAAAIRLVSRKRAVLQMASGFTAAWALVMIPFFIIYSVPLRSFHTAIVVNALVPLQGLFNFIVFIFPKVRDVRKPRRGQQEHLSWYKAIIKAYMSRGTRRRRSSLRSDCQLPQYRRFSFTSINR